MGYSPAGIFEPSLWQISSIAAPAVDKAGSNGLIGDTAYIANLAIYIPFSLATNSTIYEWWWWNGTLGTAHNVDFGIYNLDFTKVQSLGSTSGSNAASTFINTTTWTNLDIRPGNYYMAMADDSTRNYTTSTDAAGLWQSVGVVEQTTAFPLPDPMVPVAYTRAFVPYFGMNLRSTSL